jgi:hypothetical protein
MLVVLTIGCALGLNARRTARWRAGATRPRTDQNAFDGVWLKLTPPTRGWTAFTDRAVGQLVANQTTDRATFNATTGESYTFERISDVDIGRAGRDRVNVWISFAWGEPVKRAWVTDGRWLGWHAALGSTNRRLLQALQALDATERTDEEDAA